MRKWNLLMASVLVLGSALLPAAAEAPAVLGILEIRGLESLAAAAFELGKASGQPIAKEMVSMMLYGALGTMPGMGLQPDGTVRAVAFENGTDQGGLAILLPVANDGADYLSNLGQAGWQNEAETADDIQHFTAPEGAGLAWSEVYFLARGATLIAGRTADDVRRADAALAELPPILPVEGDVALQIRPAALLDVFGPKIQEGMDQAFRANPAAPPQAAAMGELYTKGYLAAAKQVADLTLGLGVANGNLNIHTRAAPVAGTTLAQWLATVRSPSAAASVVALPGALFAETAHLGDLSLLAPAYFRYLDELMQIMPAAPEAEAMKTYMEDAKAYWAQMGGDFGIALLTPTQENPLRLAEYIALKDAAPVRDLTRRLVQSANEMMKAMVATNGATMPFQIELAAGEPREYRGIAIDALTYAFTPAGEIASAWPPGIPTKFDIELAWVPGGVIASVGEAGLAETLVDRALDGPAAPLTDLAAWQALYPAPEENLVDVTHFALFDAIRSYAGLVDIHTGGSYAAKIPAGPGNIESASYAAMGGVMSRMRFSLADLAAVGQKIQETQEQAIADMQQPMDLQGEMQFEDDGEYAPESDGNPGADREEAGAAEEVEAAAPAAEETPVESAPAAAPAPAIAE